MYIKGFFGSIQMCILNFKKVRVANSKMRMHIYTIWIMHDEVLATRML